MEYSQLFNKIWFAKTTKVGLDMDYEVQKTDGRVYLLFTGSTTARDWLQDFKCTKEVYKDQDHRMKVHKGCAEVWKSGNDKVMQELIEACEETNDVSPIIAGHSLGGALALLAAEDFAYRTGRTAEVVTYGAPKICGDKGTADYIRSRCRTVRQFADRNDIVPMLPPFPGYQHVNEQKIGCRFSLSQFVKFTENHVGYGQEEKYD